MSNSVEPEFNSNVNEMIINFEREWERTRLRTCEELKRLNEGLIKYKNESNDYKKLYDEKSEHLIGIHKVLESERNDFRNLESEYASLKKLCDKLDQELDDEKQKHSKSVKDLSKSMSDLRNKINIFMFEKNKLSQELENERKKNSVLNGLGRVVNDLRDNYNCVIKEKNTLSRELAIEKRKHSESVKNLCTVVTDLSNRNNELMGEKNDWSIEKNTLLRKDEYLMRSVNQLRAENTVQMSANEKLINDHKKEIMALNSKHKIELNSLKRQKQYHENRSKEIVSFN